MILDGFDEEQFLFNASHASFAVVFPTAHGRIFSDSEETRIESTSSLSFSTPDIEDFLSRCRLKLPLLKLEDLA